MCTELLKNYNGGFVLALKYLKPLAFDRVVNVRVTLAKVFSEVFTNNCNNITKLDSTFENEEFNKIAYKLSLDKNKNVYGCFEGISSIKKIKFSDEELIHNSNDLFSNKMNILNREFGIIRNLPLNSKIKINNNFTNSLNLTVDTQDKLEESNCLEEPKSESQPELDSEDVPMKHEYS